MVERISCHPEPEAKDDIKKQGDSSSSYKTILNRFVRQSAKNDMNNKKQNAAIAERTIIADKANLKGGYCPSAASLPAKMPSLANY